MKFRGTIALAVLLAGLAVFYYLDTKRVERQEEADINAKKVFALESDEITGLRVEHAGGEAWEVRRQDDGWRVVEPLAAVADSAVVSGMLEALTGTNRSKDIETAVDRAEYGLASPVLTVTVLHGETREPDLLIGAASFNGYEVYACFEGKPGMLVLDDTVKSRLDKKLFDVRDKRVLDFAMEEVRGFRIDHPEGVLYGRKNQDDRWLLGENGSLRGDTDKIEELLRALRDLRVTTFVTERMDDPHAFGFTGDAPRVTLSVGDRMAELSLLLGTVVPGNDTDGDPNELGSYETTGDQVYATRGDGGAVILVNAAVRDRLVPYSARLRDPRPLLLERQNVRRLEIQEQDAAPVICVRTEADAWELLEPVAGSADANQVAAVLNDLEFAKAKGFEDSIGDRLADLGLAQPRCRITVSEADGKNPQTVLIGAVNNEGGIEYRYIKPASEDTAYKIATSDVAQWCRSLDEMRNKLLVEYVKRDLRTLHITAPNGVIRISSRDGETFTGMMEDGRELTDAEIEDLIWSFDFVELKDVLSGKGDIDMAALGLEQPAYRIRIATKDEVTGADAEVVLLLAAPDENGYAATVEGGALVGRLAPNSFKALREFSWES
ncbi:DUF4340 domain-containing protein [bacterium]|nr:DUF4340 domain-containing protein [candidate division CSSED10-310 bacterium]